MNLFHIVIVVVFVFYLVSLNRRTRVPFFVVDIQYAKKNEIHRE